MFKFRKVLPLVILLICAMILPVSAKVISTVGNYNSSGNYDIEVDDSHYVTFHGGVYAKYELATTNDTLVATESGKTVIVEGVGTTSTTTTFNLPDADVGLEFNFVVGGGMTPTSGGLDVPDLIINPQDTDFIYYVNSAAASTFAAGDSIKSTGNTGDSIKLICAKDLYWYVVDSRGSNWSDNN